jgi:hypothetical protein
MAFACHCAVGAVVSAGGFAFFLIFHKASDNTGYEE